MARLFDRVGDFAVEFGGHAGDAAGQDFTGFGGELGEQLRVGGDDKIRGDIMAAARHLPVRLAEVDAALNGLRFGHGKSAEFAVKGALFEEVIEFHFLQTAGCAEALLVTGGDVTGSRGARGFRLGAF